MLIFWLSVPASGFAFNTPVNFTDKERAWLQAHPKIHIGIMNAWPPMDYVDGRGRPKGIGVEFIKALNKRLGNRLEIVPGTWKKTYEAVKEKRLDALMDITPRPDRKPFFYFTRPYIEVPHLIFTHKDEPYIAELAELQDKVVGVERGFFIVDVLKTKYPRITVKEYTTTSDALDALSKGETDAYVGNRAVAMYIIENELINNLKAQSKITETSSINSIGVRKDWPVLRDILQKALDDIPLHERSFIINPSRRIIDDVMIRENFEKKLSNEEQEWLNSHLRIRIGAMEAWPPLNFIDENGVSRGIGAEYIALMNKRLGGRLVIRPASFKESFKLVKDRQLDALMDITPKKERQLFFEFTRSYLIIPHVYVGRKDGPYFDSARDLFGKTIALEKGYYNVRFFSENYPQVSVRQYPSTAEALGAVARGEADAYAGNRAVVMYLIEQELLYNLSVQGRMEKPSVRLTIGIRKDWPILARILDRAIADISREEIKAVHRRWIGELKVGELGLSVAERKWLREHPVIRVSSAADYPPFDYLISGKPAGYSVELVEILAERLGVELEYVQDTWSNMLKLAEQKKLDLIHTIFKYPKKREEYLEFTHPYKEVINVIVTRNDVDGVHQLKDLKNRRVAVVTGDSLVDAVLKVVPEEQLVYFESYREALKSVSVGKTGATLTELPTAVHHIRNLQLNSLIITGKTESLGGRDQRYRLAVRKDWPILVSILNKAMSSLSVQELRRLENKWLPKIDLLMKPASKVQLKPAEHDWIRKHPVIRFAFDENYPPYSLKNGNGEFVGIAVDIVRELARRIGVNIEIYPEGKWNKLYKAGQQKEVDVIATLVKREERGQWFEFTRPYISLAQYIICRNDMVGSINEPRHLGGRTVALVRDYSMTSVILEEIGGIIPYYVTNLNEALEAVSAGVADATVGAIGMANYLITRAGLSNLGFAALYSKGQSEQRFGVRKDWPELASILDKALASMRDDEIITLFSNWIRPEIAGIEAELGRDEIKLSDEERAWLKQHPVIRVSSEPDWPPFDFVSAGKPTGFAIDYLRLLAEKLPVQLQFITAGWAELMGKFKAGEIDVLHPLSFSKNRAEFIHFTKPFFSLSRVAVVREGEEKIKRVDQLYGKTLASGKGWSFTTYVREAHPEINLLIVDSALEGLKAVQFGEADAWIDNYPTSRFLIDSHHLNNLKLGSEIEGIAGYKSASYHIGVRKDIPILRDILQKTMDEVSPEEMQRLGEKWRIYSQKVRQLKLTREEQEWLENNRVLRVGFDSKSPPIVFTGADGEFKGIGRDYMALLSEILGLSLRYIGPQNRKTSIEALQSGKIDLIPVVSKTATVEEQLLLTGSYLQLPLVIVTGQQVAFISDMAELKEKVVAVMSHSAAHEIVSQKHPEIKLLPVETILDGLEAVRKGNVFGFIGSLPCCSHGIVRKNVGGLKISGETPYNVNFSIGVRKDNVILAGLLQKALDSIPEEKKLEISNRWVSVIYELGFDYSLLGKILVPVTVIIILLIFWNWQLNRMVAVRTTALKRREEQYRNIVESTQDYYFFYTQNTDGVFTFVSPSITTVLGFSSSEFLTHYSVYLTDNPANRAVEEMSNQTLLGREQPPCELEIFHKDGSKKWLEVKESPVFDKKGNVISVDGVARNITESKKVRKKLDEYREHLEELVNERTTELSENEERFRTLVSNSPGAVYRRQNDGKLTQSYISEAIYEISGYRPEELITDGISYYTSIIHPEDTSYVVGVIKTCMKEKRQFELTYRILHANGETRWVDERGIGVLNDGGEVARLEGIIIDVTERRLAEEKLQQYMDDLERFNRLAIGREQQIIKLKKEINSLLTQFGRKTKFKSVE